MCTQPQLQAILQAIYQKAADEFGGKLDAVILYGSYARGDYDEESDIDVMVRVKYSQAELKKFCQVFVRLSSDLSLQYNITVSIHLQDYDLFERYKDALPFYQNVERDGICVSA